MRIAPRVLGLGLMIAIVLASWNVGIAQDERDRDRDREHPTVEPPRDFAPPPPRAQAPTWDREREDDQDRGRRRERNRQRFPIPEEQGTEEGAPSAQLGPQPQLVPPRRWAGQWRLGVYAANTDTGVRITQVIPNSPAWQAGLERGDLIVTVDGYQIGYVNGRLYDLSSELQRRGGPNGRVTLLVYDHRTGELVPRQVQLERGPFDIQPQPWQPQPQPWGAARPFEGQQQPAPGTGERRFRR